MPLPLNLLAGIKIRRVFKMIKITSKTAGKVKTRYQRGNLQDLLAKRRSDHIF
jgi:transposase